MKYLKNILFAGAALALFLPGAQAQSAFKTGNPLERITKKEHCRKKFKVIWNNPVGKGGGPKTVMEIVNAKGEPCMFLARIK